MGLLLKLDFGNKNTLKNTAVNIDMPRYPGVLDEETLFLQSIISTDGREHPLRVGDRDLILKFRAHNTNPRSLDGDRGDVSGYPNPHLAVLVCSDQTVADADAANRRLPPLIIGDQEFSLDLDRTVAPLQLRSVGIFAHGHTRVDGSNSGCRPRRSTEVWR